ncbi:uncharacterized protein RHO25_009243 [Cercospora beticola]|uniref:Heterokaryon incompatibility domain-containing protein n=1 Tax=Cercospora beticola TaxID=122368 RepID=A0ABZ0NYB6_CERBT|nr:hypothetical protein RHO25_009243 [Cercospora beticola]
MQNGDNSLCRGIFVHNKHVAIRRNLFEALRRLRLENEILRIWIDALCIDQGNVAERNDQVSNMAAVYKNAARVVAWLGEGVLAEDRAMSLLLREIRINLNDRPPPESSRGLQTSGTYAGPPSGSEIISLEHWVARGPSAMNLSDLSLRRSWNFRRTLRILKLFLRRRYFTRRWVVQEISHARNNTLELRWGVYTFVNLSQFLEVMHVLEASLLTTSQTLHGSDQNIHKWTCRNLRDLSMSLTSILSCATAPAPQLPTLLAVCHSLECFDRRDILFSLISIDPLCNIQPDYRLDDFAVGVRLTQYMVANEHLVSWLLSLREHRNASKAPYLSGLLPSWGLCLTEKLVPTPMEIVLSESSNEIRESMQCSIDTNRILTCRLRYLGTIHEKETQGRSRKLRAMVLHEGTHVMRKAKLGFSRVGHGIKRGDVMFTLPGVENDHKRAVLVLRYEGGGSSGDTAFFLAAVLWTGYESVEVDGVYASGPSRRLLHSIVNDTEWPRPELTLRIK